MKVLGLMDFCRLMAKVVFPILAPTDATEGDTYKITQMLLTSVQYLWIYDYLLTVRDEVLCFV